MTTFGDKSLLVFKGNQCGSKGRGWDASVPRFKFAAYSRAPVDRLRVNGKAKIRQRKACRTMKICPDAT